MQTLKPGILVSLRTCLKGNVKYYRTDLDAKRDGEAAINSWQTTRYVEDLPELERATQARSKASNTIRAACLKTSFGLLCPTDQEPALDAAIRAAESIVSDFNRGAQHSRIAVYVLRGRIAENDSEALRAITAETRDLLDAMMGAIQSADPAAIRDACNRARQVGAMLDNRAQDAVNAAIKAARSAARKIVAEVEKRGADAQAVLAELNLQPIQTARFAFLDADDTEGAQAVADSLPAVAVQRFGGLFDEPAPEPAETSLEPAGAN